MTDTSEKTIAERAQGAAVDALDTARDAAVDAARTHVDAATDHAEAHAETAAEAASRASDAFDAGSPQAKVADQVAAGLGDVATALRDTDLEAATAKATHFARVNPVLFLGGAALLGFAAVRFLKASDPAPRQTAARSQDDPWTGHVTGHSNLARTNGRTEA